MGFVIVIDGSNFLNELDRNERDNDYILNRLSLPAIQTVIQGMLKLNGLRSHPFIHTYFVCSRQNRIGKLVGKDRDTFLTKLKSERGVTVDEIEQPHKRADNKDKEVNMHVFIRMLEMGPFARPVHDEWRHIVLISADTDFVPAIRLLSQTGTHTITVGFDSTKKPYPLALKNESYLFLELGKILKEAENDQI